MSLPDLTTEGELPVGVHRATIDEVIDRFGSGTERRQGAADALRRIYELANGTGHLDRMVVFGSFVTAKPKPNDVDVILVMRDSFQLEKCGDGVRRLFDHDQAAQEFDASVFWIRPGLLVFDTLDSFIAKWQMKRNGGRRGIVEVSA
jgi:uncharacterized protein DUF6932